MFEKEKDLAITDIIEMDFLQGFQDVFAKATNLASLTVDDNGSVTKNYIINDFCEKYTRGTFEGRKKCNECGLKWGKVAAEKGEPVIYQCHAGLTNFVVPIMADGKHSATFLGGQVLLETPNEDNFRKVAREIGVDEEEYIKALRKIEIVSLEKIEAAARLVYLGSNTLSKMAHNNIRLIKRNKLENIYRKITEAIRSSLEIEETKNIIVNIIGKLLSADRCFIMEYDKEKDEFLLVNNEYLSSESVNSRKLVDINKEMPEFVSILKERENLTLKREELRTCKASVGFELEKAVLEREKIKSAFTFPLCHFDELLGVLVIHYINEERSISDDEISLLNIVAAQIAVALHQTKLYEITRVQAEREKFSRGLIEILRSTLDKKTVKNLFTRSIGEYFKADRVFFSDFDVKKNMYLPVDEDSEYLSSDKEKSFVNYDWSSSKSIDYIQELLEKKEINVFCWDTYIKENQKSKKFIDLFEYADIKSSYNLPVLYQEKIMGYFCIEFTKKVCSLTEEQLNFIRSICHQAAIGLYHCELYTKAQESSRLKGEFIANMSHEIKTPLNIIIGFSDILSESELGRDKQLEYLTNIKTSGKHLLSLTNDIIQVSKMESGNFKLNYENIDSENLIMEVVSSIKLIAHKKNINVGTDIISANIKADKKMLIQVLYNLLNNAIKFTPPNGSVTVKSCLDNDKLFISVEDTGIGISIEDQDLIFEKFKQVDSSYSRQHHGAGLGLSITKNLVELHDGLIHVDSIKGKGSRFWFVLPNASNKLN